MEAQDKENRRENVQEKKMQQTHGFSSKILGPMKAEEKVDRYGEIDR